MILRHAGTCQYPWLKRWHVTCLHNRYVRQHTALWQDLHRGLVTTGRLKQALGMHEEQAAKIVGFSKAMVRTGTLVCEPKAACMEAHLTQRSRCCIAVMCVPGCLCADHSNSSTSTQLQPSKKGASRQMDSSSGLLSQQTLPFTEGQPLLAICMEPCRPGSAVC